MTKPERDLTGIPTISEEQELLRYGLCRVALPSVLSDDGDGSAANHNNNNNSNNKWAKELSQVTPEILAGEGDGEYAFYRNILEEPDFPFDSILSESSAIGQAILFYFPIKKLDEIRLDDAFCVHYNMDQDDTSGAKHTDPSDITINMCLEKSDDAQGSQVLFYGTKKLLSTTYFEDNGSSCNDDTPPPPELFLVSQEPGFATIHFGGHPHETISLKNGTRTNIVLTYCYSDPTRSEAMTRTCY